MRPARATEENTISSGSLLRRGTQNIPGSPPPADRLHPRDRGGGASCQSSMMDPNSRCAARRVLSERGMMSSNPGSWSRSCSVESLTSLLFSLSLMKALTIFISPVILLQALRTSCGLQMFRTIKRRETHKTDLFFMKRNGFTTSNGADSRRVDPVNLRKPCFNGRGESYLHELHQERLQVLILVLMERGGLMSS